MKRPGTETRVQSFCWCHTDIVLVTYTDVWDGVTKSCGREACTPTTMRRPT